MGRQKIMFPIILITLIFCLSVVGVLAIKYEWFYGKTVSDEETVKRYLAKEKSAKILDKTISFLCFGFSIIFLFIFFYWTFGRFIMWAYYLFV